MVASKIRSCRYTSTACVRRACASPRKRINDGTSLKRVKLTAQASLRVADATGHVTDAALQAAPWAKPGFCGAWVSKQPEWAQSAIILGLMAAGIVSTHFIYTSLAPWLVARAPFLRHYMTVAQYLWPAFYAFVGAMHFIEHEKVCRAVPFQGAWGFWYLPGSPSFHTNWTGVAEISGGLGCILGALKLPMLPSWMLPVSAACMFLLTVVIFPANVLMWTHNAPLPLDSMQPAYEAGDRKGIAGLPYHIPRAILQAVFLATWLGLAMAHA